MNKITAPAVCADNQRRTCLLLSIGSTAEFIPLSIENGFNVEKMPATQFNGLYEQLVDYPVARCAALYAQYSMSVGASPEALEHLGRFTKLSQKEIDMATAKKSAVKAEKKPTAKVAVEKPTKATKTKAAVAELKIAKPKVTGASAAQMFKDLIMAGNLTDDRIFEKVQAAHGLDDKKRSYVGWYRKDLTKKGMNPPEAKGGK